MGNILSISCDGAIFNRCLDCFLGKAAYIRNLQENVVSLETELRKLIAAKDDVMTSVVNAERKQMRRRNQVQIWFSRVDAVKTEADELIRDGSQEIEKLCLGGYCSKNCKSSYKFGKNVAKLLRDVKTLIGEGVFEEVAVIGPGPVAEERPIESIVVGLQSQLEQVWRCLLEEPVGMIGLYGMGGVGKTTLLTQINNKFAESPNDFDHVIWVVVSKDLHLERIQETIGKKIGLYDDSWKNKSPEDKAQDIFNTLSKKMFALLLDDIWERVDLKKVGVPLPSRQNSKVKVVFTTRDVGVCGRMDARQNFEVGCLSDDDAWELFREKVGEKFFESDHGILELAKGVAKECGGLPLALITIGRAMAYKKTLEEWRYAREVLRRSASEFAGLGKEVYPILKFSYDSLPNDTIRSCFLYCCLYPEDYSISKRNLVDYWICEGFLEESDWVGAKDKGFSIVGTLVFACLLEEVEDDDKVKMHDVIRDMALWITCEIEKEKHNFLIYTGVRLEKTTDVKVWENVRRMSLMQNEFKNLSELPRCPRLITLFLNNNRYLRISNGDFLQFMHFLKVLNMSNIERLNNLLLEISKLVSLQLLDISFTKIKELPKELKALVNLTYLNLEWADKLHLIPQRLLSNFSKLRVLRMFATGFSQYQVVSVDNVLFGGGKRLADELLGLKCLEELDFTLTTSHALQYFLSSPKFRRCTRALFLSELEDSKSIYASSLLDLVHLNSLTFNNCEILEELEIDYTRELPKRCFDNLQSVDIFNCYMLKDLTFLVFAPHLKALRVYCCTNMEELIRVGRCGKIPDQMVGNLFSKLQKLHLLCLDNLQRIYWKPLPFTHLKEMEVSQCVELKKLPLDSNSAKGHKIVIHGEEDWWNKLRWEDEATQNAFHQCFKAYKMKVNGH